MSDSIKAMFDKLNSDKAFAERFGNLKNEQELAELLDECGVSVEEFKAGLVASNRELSDDELDQVAGGGSGWRIIEETEEGGRAEYISEFSKWEFVSADMTFKGDDWTEFKETKYKDDPYTE